MKAIDKRTGIITTVTPYYLHGRIVAYVGKLYGSIGVLLAEKYAYLPDELDLDYEYRKSQNG